MRKFFMLFCLCVVLSASCVVSAAAPSAPMKTPPQTISDLQKERVNQFFYRKQKMNEEEELRRKNFPVKNSFGQEPKMRVALFENVSQISVTANVDFVIGASETGRELKNFFGGKVMTIAKTNGKAILISGQKFSGEEFFIRSAYEKSQGIFTINDKKFRGNLKIFVQNNGLLVVNEINLDDYIAGVINKEMSPSFPKEALKAQTVAARTFALYMKNQAAHGEKFDVCDKSHCQVYGGIAAETREGLIAVRETRGEVMQFDGKEIYAAFHASSGGMTAASEEMAGQILPYLRPVRSLEDFCDENKTIEWQIELPVADFLSKLKLTNLGVLKQMEIAPLDIDFEKKEIGRGRYESGRVNLLRLVGSSKTIEVSGKTMRSLLNLPSTLFDVRTPTSRNKSGIVKVSRNDKIILQGYGRGHGLGLSQWGAYGMTKNSKTNDYRKILNKYYKGITLKKLF